jgi:hypothetical protein
MRIKGLEPPRATETISGLIDKQSLLPLLDSHFDWNVPKLKFLRPSILRGKSHCWKKADHSSEVPGSDHRDRGRGPANSGAIQQCYTPHCCPEFIRILFDVGANPSAQLGSEFRRFIRRNNPGTITIPFHVFSIRCVPHCSA